MIFMMKLKIICKKFIYDNLCKFIYHINKKQESALKIKTFKTLLV